jgi:hypothetical protein
MQKPWISAMQPRKGTTTHHLGNNKGKCDERPRTSDEAAIIRMNKECNSLVHYAHLKEQNSIDFFIRAH